MIKKIYKQYPTYSLHLHPTTVISTVNGTVAEFNPSLWIKVSKDVIQSGKWRGHSQDKVNVLIMDLEGDAQL